MSEGNERHVGQPAVLHADRPVTDFAQERLGRTKLVERVARVVARASSAHGRAVAITAPWGAGKSSFLNLLELRMVGKGAFDESDESDGTPLYSLRGAGDVWPRVLRFNPWLYSEAGQVVAAYFEAMAEALSDVDGVSHDLRTLGSRLVAGVDKRDEPGDRAAVVRVASPSDVQKLRTQVRRRMSELPGRLIVMIDDVDRLKPAAIRALFKSLRLIGDLPNVTYVVAYDEDIVARAVGRGDADEGRRYMEKFFQLVVALPDQLPEQRYSRLHETLRLVVQASFSETDGDVVDRQRFDALITNHLAPIYDTERAFKRLYNRLLTILPCDPTWCSVEDIVALEVLHDRFPRAYSALNNVGKALCCRETDPAELSDAENVLRVVAEVRQASSARSVGGAGHRANRDGERVAGLLRFLFPAISQAEHAVVGGGQRSSEGESAGDALYWQMAVSGRVASVDHFDSYFGGDLEFAPRGASQLLSVLATGTDGEISTYLLDSVREHGGTGRLAKTVANASPEHWNVVGHEKTEFLLSLATKYWLEGVLHPDGAGDVSSGFAMTPLGTDGAQFAASVAKKTESEERATEVLGAAIDASGSIGALVGLARQLPGGDWNSDQLTVRCVARICHLLPALAETGTSFSEAAWSWTPTPPEELANFLRGMAGREKLGLQWGLRDTTSPEALERAADAVLRLAESTPTIAESAALFAEASARREEHGLSG